jgi:hypothetical protein
MTDQTATTYYAAAYIHIGFPVPDSYKTYLGNAKNQYFTFEIGIHKLKKIKGNPHI